MEKPNTDVLNAQIAGSKVASRQEMNLRIQKAKMLRRTFNEVQKLRNDPTISPEMKKVLSQSAAATYDGMLRAERKVTSQVEKVLAYNFDSVCDLFSVNEEKFPNDPSVTVIDYDED